MTVFDWILLGLLLGSALLGLWRGLVHEVVSLGSWIAAFILAPWFANDAAAHLPLERLGADLRYAAGFVVVFVGTLVFGVLCAFVAKKLLSVVGLRPIDRLLGGVFGLLRGGLLLLAVALVFEVTPLHTTQAWQDSHLAGALRSLLKNLKPALPADFGRYLP